LIALRGTPSSPSDAYDDDDEGMNGEDIMAAGSKYTEEFKIKVAEATLEEGSTLKSVGEKFGVNPTLVRNWRIKYLDETPSEGGDGAMKKYDALDQEKNPDGIATPLSGLDDEVWDRGYYCETDDGIWYEVYVNENIKEIWGDFELEDPEEKEMFEGFSDFNVSMFGDYGQITFFVAKGDDENTLDALTEIFI